jgi:hypothetical protein
MLVHLQAFFPGRETGKKPVSIILLNNLVTCYLGDPDAEHIQSEEHLVHWITMLKIGKVLEFSSGPTSGLYNQHIKITMVIINVMPQF